MEVSSDTGLKQFHEEGVDGGQHASCRYLGQGGVGQSTERAQ